MTSKWLPLALTFVPSPAFAGHGGMMEKCASHMGCGHGGALGILAMAAVAALGCYVLRQGAKDAGALKWAGQIVGWTLAVGGLVAFLGLGCKLVRGMCHKGGASAAVCPITGQAM